MVTTFSPSLTFLPKGRHLFLQIGDKYCMHLTRHELHKSIKNLHGIRSFLCHNNTAKALKVEMDLCRSSPLDQVIHFPHCGKPRQPLKVAEEITLSENENSIAWKTKSFSFNTCSASNNSLLATYRSGWLQKLPTYTRLTCALMFSIYSEERNHTSGFPRIFDRDHSRAP